MSSLKHGRTPENGETVRAYRNLNTGAWSVQGRRREGKSGWVVIAHLHTLAVDCVEFKVSAAGCARAVREGRRNVHAFAVGTFRTSTDTTPNGNRLRYNPFRQSFFTACDDRIDTAQAVVFGHDGYCVVR
jgi:hypothetical protein